MDLEKRVDNLEKLVNSLIKTINNNKFYTDADLSWCRQTSQELSEQKADLTALSDNSEAIGQPASKTYKKDETFTDKSGQLFKALAPIWQGSKLVEGGNVIISDAPQSSANDCVYFVEDLPFSLDRVDSVTIYRWNRLYPSDVKFDVDLNKNGFVLDSIYEFEGSSHEKITEEKYKKGATLC